MQFTADKFCKNMNKKIASEVAVGIILLVAVAIGGVFYWQNKINGQQPAGDDHQRACTEEAKICPDGSSVGRTGPSCEFAPCPENGKQDAVNNGPQQVVGNDRDEQRYIGSAGYVWCEEKQKCLRTWEEGCISK